MATFCRWSSTSFSEVREERMIAILKGGLVLITLILMVVCFFWLNQLVKEWSGYYLIEWFPIIFVFLVLSSIIGTIIETTKESKKE
jgi:hypothetical protein